MSWNKRTLLSMLIAGLLLGAFGAGHAATRAEVGDRLEDFRRFFIDFQAAPDYAIPRDLLAECHGVLIMRQYKAGFVFGIKGGDGVVFLHNRATNSWSPPAFVATGEGSFGLQIGGQAIDAIILIMNQAGVDMLMKTRFKIGVDASVAAGPVGRDVSAQVGPGTALLAYSRTKGLYAGASFEGGVVLNHDTFNQALYGRSIGTREILMGRSMPIPPEAEPIISTLRTYSEQRGSNRTTDRVRGQSQERLQQPSSVDQSGYWQPDSPYQPQYQGQTASPYEPQPQYQPYYQNQQQMPVPAAPSYTLPAAATPAPIVTPAEQAALDAAASDAAVQAQIAAQAAQRAQIAAENAAARAAAARAGR